MFEAQVFKRRLRTSFSGMRGTRSGPSLPGSGSVGDRRAKNRLNEGEDSGEPSRAREACGLSWNFSGRPWPSFGEAWVLKLNAGIAHGPSAAAARDGSDEPSADLRAQPGRHHGTLLGEEENPGNPARKIRQTELLVGYSAHCICCLF